jgi:hypothetical protein
MLLGEPAIEPSVDDNLVGAVEGFAFRARRSGTAASIKVYLDQRDRATTVVAGLYSSRQGHPGSLLASGSMRSPKAGAWNSVAVNSARLRSGTMYWLAVLGKGGVIYFRDRSHGLCSSEMASSRKSQSLPRTWAAGPSSRGCLISAYVRGRARVSSTSTLGGGTQVFGTNAPGGTTTTDGTTTPTTTAPASPGTTVTLSPVTTGAPTISGSPIVGRTLTTSSGSWTNSPTSYAYQWEDCDSLAVLCNAVGGATGSSYVLGGGDVGGTVRVVVTASNAGGSSSASSAATGVVVGSVLAPVNSGLPVVSGQAVQGQTLSASSGSWSGSPSSFGYQWEDCGSGGGGCVAVGGATGSSYVLGGGDVGGTVRVVVTASNAGGSSSASSAATGVVVGSGGGGALPVSTVGPYFTGSTGTTSSCSNGCAVVGQTLGVGTGSWANSPTGFSYQWERCTTTSAQPPTTGSCSAISGATGSTYTVQSADSGYSLVPIVTASNAGGSTSTSLAGTCDTGEMLGVVANAYTASVPNAQPAGCAPISAVVATTAGGEKFCTNAVTTCGYGDPMNQTTGVPAGVTPSASGACATYAGGKSISSGTVTINGCEIDGRISVSGTANVTIENSDIAYADETGAGAVSLSGATASLTVEYSTIHGTGYTTSGSLAFGVYTHTGGAAVTIDHVFFYNGDRIFMNYTENSQTPTVTNSFCWHNADVASSGSTEHYECVYTGPPANITEKNDVLMNLIGQTGANYVDDNTGSCCGVVDLENNLMGGGDYTFYGGASLVSSETYLNNRVTRALYNTGGLYGPGSYNSTGTFTQTGNIWDDTNTTANP